MYSVKLLIVSCLLTVTIGLTSINAHANQESRFLIPILSLLFEQQEAGTINDMFGGNFVVSPRAFDDTVPAVNCDSVFTSTSALESAASTNMTPGTTLCLADGEYNSLEVSFGGAGTAQNPIKIAAQNSGAAVIRGGDMRINMTGTYVVLQGIQFIDGQSASSDLLQTRVGSAACNHCRVTEISIINIDAGQNRVQDRGRWIHLYGTHNRVDHNWFAGKVTGAPLLNTNRDIPEGGSVDDVPENFHVIDHNYFGDRAPIDGRAYARNGDNEHEGIQIGTSFAHEGNAFTTVAFNYFERIDGEAEVISVKSSGNVIFNNTIRDSYGSITNRHGRKTLIANNFVIGDGHPFSGGLRIVDDSHRVINNYVGGARFLSTRFHGGIVLHNTDNSTSNGYQVFENNLVAFNTVTDSVNSLNVNGGNRNNPPRDVRFVNNIIDDAVGPVIRDADLGGLPADSVYAGNYVEGPAFSDDPAITSFTGFNQETIDLQDDAQGIARPVSPTALPADISANIAPFDAIIDDFDGQARGASPNSGADQASAGAGNDTFGILNTNDVGPLNYRPPFANSIVGRVAINNPGFDDLAQGWTFSPGAQVTTIADDVFARGAAGRIFNTSGRISQTLAVEPNTNYAMTAFTEGPILLGANVNGSDTSGEFNNSSYRHSQFEFNSGSASSITLFAELDNLVASTASIQAASFDRSGSDSFSSSASNANPWIIVEGSNLGQVQSSSNSASGSDGSVRFRYNTVAEADAADAAEVNPATAQNRLMISQVITNLPANTDFELSAWVVADTGITGTMGIIAGDIRDINGTLDNSTISSKVLDDDALSSAGAPRGDDNFRRDSLTFNSGSNTTLTVFFRYNASSYDQTNPVFRNGDPNSTIENSDLRIDDIELSFEGPTPAGEEALVDEIRLVSFPGD